MESRLKTQLLLIGMTQTELAKRIGVDRVDVGRAVKHGMGSKRTKARIAKYLNIPVAELFPDGEGGR